MPYVAPVRSLQFAVEHVGAPDTGAATLSSEDITGILEEAARFAERELAPLNAPGDRIGARRAADGAVATPPGFRAAYQAWVSAGWNGVTLPVEWGGMGLSTAMGVAVMELWTSACMAFGVGVLLSHGAVELLVEHGSPELQKTYLPPLVSGEWSATMALTEPQAGSDLGAIRTRATPQDDGSYRIIGEKIFITFGEHDLTDNIVHLVLARIDGGPAGTRGLSLFVVPKYLPDADGKPGVRNDVQCTGIEHKMGLHASPTCAMSFGSETGAVGWLVGGENQGLAAMFIMMNRARLGTGMQGVSIAERATQRAEAFAQTRVQGRVPGGARDQPIIHHPDVRRMLRTMKAWTAAGRALGYGAASAIESSVVGETPDDRHLGQTRAALLTPLVKAFCSELGVEVASLGIQVHGGMGYVEETGAAQYYRDARITPIYEGTNGIQAIDLAMRKVRKDGGAAARAEFARFRSIAQAAAGHEDLSRTSVILTASLDALEAATVSILADDRPEDDILYVATSYLRLFAQTAAGALLSSQALSAVQQLDKDDPLRASVLDAADVFAVNVMTNAPALSAIVRDRP